MRLRRLTVLASAVAIALVGLVSAPPAQAAADLGTVVWSASLSPDSFPSASVSDTFSFNNSSGASVMLVNASGSVSNGGFPCAPHQCYVSGGFSETFAVDGLGTIEIQDAFGSLLATLTFGGGTAAATPTLVASQPPSVTATPGNGVVQLSITPGTGGTGTAKLYGIEYRPTSSCPAGRTLTPRPATDSTGQCAPCPTARALVPRPNFDALVACPKGVASVLAGASGSATTTITGLENGREYSFSVKEMTTDQLWSGATTVASTPTAAATCSALSVDVAHPGGKDAATVTSPVSGGTPPAVYPFIAPPYGGEVKEPAMGAWTSAGATGAAGGEFATFTPTTDKPCPITVTAPEGTQLSLSTGGAWDAGAASVTVYSGTPVYVFGVKTGDYTIPFKAGATNALNASPKVRIGTVPQAAYNIAVTPVTQTLNASALGTAKVSVTDVFGNPVAGAKVAVAATGAVLLAGYNTSQEVTTGATGSQDVTLLTGSAAGQGSVTATAPATSTAWAWQTGYAKPTGFAEPVKSASASLTISVPVTKSITITDSGRTEVSGKAGVYVLGTATGFTAGDTLKVFVRFPGGEYTEGSAKPAIGPDGAFEWSRKTGKKTYVYLATPDGTITSNRVIIPAK